MQIKQELPQFKNQATLIITTGKQHAIIYLAKNGEIDKLNEIQIETPTYSDREGHFERRSKNLNIGSGSVYEDDTKEKIVKDFIKKIEEEIKKFKDIKQLYCFCPDYMKNYLKEVIDKNIDKSKIFTGNHTDKHPFKLLETIKEN